MTRRTLFVLLLVASCKHATPASRGHLTKVTLDGMPVEISLPDDFRLDAKDSDETLGMVSFDRESDRPVVGAPSQIVTAFLTGTRDVTVPATLDAAVAQARADECKPGLRCDELGREALSPAEGGGFLVSLENASSVVVYALKPGPKGRALLCGAQAFHPFTQPGVKSWLDEPAKVKEAQAMIEAICRSAKA